MSWQQHPFAVAVAASAATITLGATLVFTAIIPTWLKSKENEIAVLKTAKDQEIAVLRTESTTLKTQLDGLSNRLRTIEAENLKLRGDLDRLSPDSLFSVDDVYPRGFRSVRIGDRLDVLSKVYSAEKQSNRDEAPWVAVDLSNPGLFSRITYYYDEDASEKTVTSILFHFQERDGQTFNLLKQALIDKYSETTMEEKKAWGKKELVWSGIQKHTLKLSDRRLHISRDK